jgi:hypothetical protein
LSSRKLAVSRSSVRWLNRLWNLRSLSFFAVAREGRPPQTMRFSEFYTRPGCTPVNASPERSPVQTHHSGPKLMANLYFVRLFHSLLSNDFADAPYSYSKRSSKATRPIDPNATPNRLDQLCSCKLRLRRASPTVGSHSRHRVRVRRSPMRGTNCISADFSYKPL